MYVQVGTAPEGYVRAYPLRNFDIFTVKCKDREYTLEFEDMLLYEVVFKGYDQWMQSIYERTGVVFTPEELNNLTKY
jgi:hypothetical protein